MARKKPTQPAPAPELTPEQRAAAEARHAAYQRVTDEHEELLTALRTMTERLAPAFGGRVCSRSRNGVEVVFGRPEPTWGGMAGPGLAQAEVEIDHRSVQPAIETGTPLRLRVRFQSYAVVGNERADDAEAQGRALIEAAQFARAVIAAVQKEAAPPPEGEGAAQASKEAAG